MNDGSTRINETALKFWHGYAVLDKANDSRELYVYSEELLPFVTGKIKATEIKNNIKTKSSVTGGFSGNLSTTNALRCIYRDSDSNRAFPPSVRKGEQVLIYNNGDSDTWYWKSEGRNDELRRTDTLRYGCSGTLDNVAVPSDDNTYFIEVDTRTKHHIKLSTSMDDGEKYRYTILIDADNNKIMIGDNEENIISIDSAHPRVCMKNKSNSLIDLNAENIIISCKKDITIKSESGQLALYSKDKMLQTTESTLDIKSTGKMTVETDSQYSLRSSSTMSITCGSSMTTKVSSSTKWSTGSDFNLTSGSSYTLNCSGGYTVNSGGGGIYKGSVMTMSVSRLNIGG